MPPSSEALRLPAPGVSLSKVTVDPGTVYPCSPRSWLVSNGSHLPPSLPSLDESTPLPCAGPQDTPIIVILNDLVPLARQAAAFHGTHSDPDTCPSSYRYACVYGANTVLAAQRELKIGVRPGFGFVSLLASPSDPSHRFDCMYLRFLAIHYAVEAQGRRPRRLVWDLSFAAVFAARALRPLYPELAWPLPVPDKFKTQANSFRMRSRKKRQTFLGSNVQGMMEKFIMNSAHLQCLRTSDRAMLCATDLASNKVPLVPTYGYPALGAKNNFFRDTAALELANYWRRLERGPLGQRTCADDISRRKGDSDVAFALLQTLHGFTMTQALLCAVDTYKPGLLQLEHMREDGWPKELKCIWFMMNDAAMAIFVLSVLEYAMEKDVEEVPVGLTRKMFGHIDKCMTYVRDKSLRDSEYTERLQLLSCGEDESTTYVLSLLIDDVISSACLPAWRGLQADPDARPVVTPCVVGRPKARSPGPLARAAAEELRTYLFPPPSHHSAADREKPDSCLTLPTWAAYDAAKSLHALWHGDGPVGDASVVMPVARETESGAQHVQAQEQVCDGGRPDQPGGEDSPLPRVQGPRAYMRTCEEESFDAVVALGTSESERKRARVTRDDRVEGVVTFSEKGEDGRESLAVTPPRPASQVIDDGHALPENILTDRTTRSERPCAADVVPSHVSKQPFPLRPRRIPDPGDCPSGKPSPSRDVHNQNYLGPAEREAHGEDNVFANSECAHDAPLCKTALRRVEGSPLQGSPIFVDTPERVANSRRDANDNEKHVVVLNTPSNTPERVASTRRDANGNEDHVVVLDTPSDTPVRRATRGRKEPEEAECITITDTPEGGRSSALPRVTKQGRTHGSGDGVVRSCEDAPCRVRRAPASSLEKGAGRSGAGRHGSPLVCKIPDDNAHIASPSPGHAPSQSLRHNPIVRSRYCFDNCYHDGLQTEEGVYTFAATNFGKRQLLLTCSALGFTPSQFGMQAFTTGHAIIPGLALDSSLNRTAGEYFQPSRRACTYAAIAFSEARISHALCTQRKRNWGDGEQFCCKSVKTCRARDVPCPCKSCITNALHSEEGIVVYDESDDCFAKKYGTDPDFRQVKLKWNGVSAEVKWGFEDRDGLSFARDDDTRRKEKGGLLLIAETIRNDESADERTVYSAENWRVMVTHDYRIRMGCRGVAWRAKYEMCSAYFDGALGTVLDRAVPVPGETLRHETDVHARTHPQLYAMQLSVLMTFPGASNQVVQHRHDVDAVDETSNRPDHPQTLFRPRSTFFAMASLPFQAVDTERLLAESSGFCIHSIPLWIDSEWNRKLLDGRSVNVSSQGDAASDVKGRTVPTTELLKRIQVMYGSVLMHRADTGHRGDAGMDTDDFDGLVSTCLSAAESRRDEVQWSTAALDELSCYLSPQLHVEFAPRANCAHDAEKK